MIRLSEVADAFLPDLEAQYGNRLLPGQRNALSAILQCRTEACGTAAIRCHDCQNEDSFPLSCGHRFCPQSQNEAVEQWLERQRTKLLPVEYYLITFTLPFQLRALVDANQRAAYDLLIKLAWQTLYEFGLNDKTLQGRLGATAVLHTHSRALDFHPHVHIVVPAGAIDRVNNRWRTKQGKFLFREKALAKVFRGKWFQAMKEQGWTVKANLPHKWVVDCEWVGNGEKALLYLGRYLYRGYWRRRTSWPAKTATSPSATPRTAAPPRRVSWPAPTFSGSCCNTSCPKPSAGPETTASCTATATADRAPAPAASGLPAKAQGQAPSVLQAMRRRGHLDRDPVPEQSETTGSAGSDAPGDADVTARANTRLADRGIEP